MPKPETKSTSLSAEDLIIATGLGTPPEASTGAPLVTNSEEADINAMLRKLLVGRMLKEQAKEAEEADSAKRFVLARTEDAKHQREQLENTQRVCNHMKEGGRGTRLGGQRLSSGSLILICSWCRKEFDEKTTPPHLFPSMDTIGG